MGNEKNLRSFTSETGRAAGKIGGVRSGESRRRKANLQKAMQALLVAKGGATIDGIEVTNEEALCMAMLTEALSGGKNNVAAFNAISQIMKSVEEAQERKARVKKIEAETDEIRQRIQESAESGGAVVNIVDDIPDSPVSGATEVAVFDALGESQREAGDGAGTDQTD